MLILIDLVAELIFGTWNSLDSTNLRKLSNDFFHSWLWLEITLQNTQGFSWKHSISNFFQICWQFNLNHWMITGSLYTIYVLDFLYLPEKIYCCILATKLMTNDDANRSKTIEFVWKIQNQWWRKLHLNNPKRRSCQW